MGHEASGRCTLGARSETVRALLESTLIILRGPTLKRQIALPGVTELRVEGSSLCFTTEGEPVVLVLGTDEARKWFKKISTPPPTLAAKLGVSEKTPALVLGDASDVALTEALAGATTKRAQDAAMLVAVVLSEADLDRALAKHANMPCPAIWLVHVKGKAAALGDSAIRTRLRASGYMDNKISAVSERYTATRYARR